MPTKRTILFVLSIVSIAFLVACTPTSSPLPTSDQASAVATIVAATQTALAEEQVPKAAPTLQPTAQEPTPTATLLPSTEAPSPTAEPTPATFIAYIKNGNVHVWTGLAGSMPLTDTQDAVQVRISGDGRLVAYLRQDPTDKFTQELWVVSVNDPSNTQVLVSSLELAALNPAEPNLYIGGIGIQDFSWRTGTHQLVYTTIILHEGPGFSPNHDLHLVDVDSLEKTTLLENGEGGLFYFSPDGEQLALSKPASISLINADGSDFRENVLTFPEVVTYSEYQYHPHPVWAADSSSLRVTIPPADPLGEILAPTGLWRILTDGSSAVKLGDIYALPFSWPDNAFSPNLEKVAYAMPVEIPSDNQRELHISNPDGSADVTYDSSVSLQFKSWAPDSEHFIYAINDGNRIGLYMGSTGGQPVLIYPDPNQVRDIRWLDHERFAHLRANYDQWELRITSLAGNDLVLIDTLPDSSPEFDALP